MTSTSFRKRCCFLCENKDHHHLHVLLVPPHQILSPSIRKHNQTQTSKKPFLRQTFLLLLALYKDIRLDLESGTYRQALLWVYHFVHRHRHLRLHPRPHHPHR